MSINPQISEAGTLLISYHISLPMSSNGLFAAVPFPCCVCGSANFLYRGSLNGCKWVASYGEFRQPVSLAQWTSKAHPSCLPCSSSGFLAYRSTYRRSTSTRPMRFCSHASSTETEGNSRVMIGIFRSTPAYVPREPGVG